MDLLAFSCNTMALKTFPFVSLNRVNTYVGRQSSTYRGMQCQRLKKGKRAHKHNFPSSYFFQHILCRSCHFYIDPPLKLLAAVKLLFVLLLQKPQCVAALVVVIKDIYVATGLFFCFQFTWITSITVITSITSSATAYWVTSSRVFLAAGGNVFLWKK